MRIEAVETLRADRWGYIRITTDTGITGVGEVGVWAFPDAAASVVSTLTPYLLGKDPLAIEHHWQYMYRFSHFGGSVVMAALSAIDIALWDIAGKRFDVPIHRLLGGPTRDRVRLYMHVNGASLEDLVASATRAVQRGFTAVRFDPFIAKWPTLSHSDLIDDATARVAAVREAVGPSIDICVECHFKLSYADAFDVARALSPFRILFLEDPFPPESPRHVAAAASQMPVPIATGERLVNLQEFKDLLSAGPVAYVRPDLCLAGGISQVRKIAAVAEAFNVGVIPHNPLSPVSTAACLQIDAAISNFVLQEYVDESEDPQRSLLMEPLVVRDGHMLLPDSPGLGVELNLDYLATLPAFDRDYTTPVRPDGSPADY